MAVYQYGDRNGYMHVSKDCSPCGNNVCIVRIIIIVCFSDSQALGDLVMHTSGNDEHQEHGLEY